MKLIEFGHGGSPIWSMVAIVCLRALDHNEAIDENVIRLSQPPFKIALSYALMWVYGNHYRMEDETSDCHTTYDSGIASIFI